MGAHSRVAELSPVPALVHGLPKGLELRAVPDLLHGLFFDISEVALEPGAAAGGDLAPLVHFEPPERIEAPNPSRSGGIVPGHLGKPGPRGFLIWIHKKTWYTFPMNEFYSLTSFRFEFNRKKTPPPCRFYQVDTRFIKCNQG